MTAGGEKSAAMSRRAVLMYAAMLFAVVILFMVLSYLIDARGDSEVAALSEQNTSALEKIEALRSENERLHLENEELATAVAELEDELRQAHLDREEEAARIEERYSAEYDELLSRHNELLEQLEGGGNDQTIILH